MRDGELIHLGVSAPIAHEPCRMLTNAPLAFGNGGMLVWLCPPDNALSYATVTFEYAARDPDTIVRELFADEQRGQGVSAPRCRRVEAPAGLRRMQRCESTFPHGASEGHLLAYVGGREDFFVRIMTACVGTQCDAALPQFEALATALSFDQ
ncbi:MAG TPA: hypothetical protein VM915_15700 [Verrucomicrobiae bacterium]|nr:hypothetical protein [Verrucomicrobiae bacterium]